MKRWYSGMVAVWVAATGLTTPAQETAAPPVRAVAPAAAGDIAELLAGGRQALQDGKWAGAAALFEKTLSLEAGNQEALFGLSAAYIQMDKFDEALPMLLTLRRQLPRNPMVKNNLAWVYLKARDAAGRDPRQAVKLAREAVFDMPADPSFWDTLAEAHYATGDYERALRAAQSAFRLNTQAGTPPSAASRELLARCRKAAGADAAANPDDEP